jgi:hypothetical protein
MAKEWILKRHCFVVMSVLGLQICGLAQSFDVGWSTPLIRDQTGVAGETLIWSGWYSETFERSGFSPDDFDIHNVSINWDGSTPEGTVNLSVPRIVNGAYVPDDDIFRFIISSGASPGTYYGSLFIDGYAADGRYDDDSENFTITIVPEPYEYGLIAVAGLIGWMAWDRRSRKQQQAA